MADGYFTFFQEESFVMFKIKTCKEIIQVFYFGSIFGRKKFCIKLADVTVVYFIKKPDKKGPRKWVSPQIRRILEQSGKEFGEVIMPEDGDDDL